MQEVPTRLHTASSQLNDLYQDLDSFIDELADAAPYKSKVMDGTTWPSGVSGVVSLQQFPHFFFFFFGEPLQGGIHAKRIDKIFMTFCILFNEIGTFNTP